MGSSSKVGGEGRGSRVSGVYGTAAVGSSVVGSGVEGLQGSGSEVKDLGSGIVRSRVEDLGPVSRASRVESRGSRV
eukprot:2929053-Rhodomonas_salina.1